jgi:Yip1-like protein
VAPSAASSRRVPHSPQNFTVGAFGDPHCGHGVASAIPHSPQNFLPGSFCAPQAPQITPTTLQLSRKRPVPPSGRADAAYALAVTPEQRLWWRRLLLVLVRPREVFAALRSHDEDDDAARQEPVLLVVLLAGMAAVVLSPAWREVLDQPLVDGLSAVVLTFVAGGFEGAVLYVVVGGAVHLAARGMGSQERFRTTRHVLAFAAVPLALSLAVVVPAALLSYGGDWFDAGGGDEGTGGRLLLGLGLAFVAWAVGLLVLGLRETLRLAWLGVAGTLLLGGVLLAGLAVLPSVV